ncbi:MAG TPA: efflux RND transporter periplasmic adaptor subunit [Polyangiales bacterium]|nr:efflux RND transporter periplasmic adaptor subunit [Polyangiales bacterium]
MSLGACQKKDLPKLPPATGEQAPPAPKIPKLAELAKQSGAADTPVAARAGTGSLQALHSAALGPKDSGLLTAIAVDEGERVRKGQVVFRQDDEQAKLALEQARTQVATAKVQQASAQLDLDRTRQLHERGSVPQDALDQAKSRADAADSMVAQAQASVNLAQRRLANLVVTSPIDGVVAEKRMNVGEIATMMPPSVVLVVQNIDVLELRARLPENALKTVGEGAQLEVRFPALDETRKVKVQRIAPTVDPRTRTIEIVAQVDNKDHRLKAGMLAEVAYADAATAKPPTAQASSPRAEADRAAR